MFLSIDIETYSSVDLTKAGVYKYVEAPDFQILLMAYAYGDGAIHILDLTKEKIPEQVKIDIACNYEVKKSAFNANFERVCLSKHLGIDGYMDPELWICSAVKSRYAGYPGYLEGAAREAGLEQQKDKTGKQLIQYFCKPCKPTKKNGGRTRNLPEHDPEKWEQFKSYCVQDVAVERALQNKLQGTPVNTDEWKLWYLDQEINDRGCQLDMRLVKNALEFNKQHTTRLRNRMQEITGCENPNSLPQLKRWLMEKTGKHIGALDKETVPQLIKETKDPDVKEVLEIRRELGKTSTSKYQAMDRTVCADERARGLLMFYGAARTGRWAGRLIQVQNLPQNKIPDLALARNLVRDGKFDLLELFYDSPPVILSQLIRTAFIARPGKKLIISDFSAIEARVIAWLADEQWRLNVFNSHGKIYEASAAAMFHVPIESIDKGSPLRSKGKIAELALGYQGSIGALKSMGGEKMGLSVDEMKHIVDTWRSANPRIVQLWDDIEEAAMRVIDTQAERPIETHGLKISYYLNGLTIRLPSGRTLRYPKAQIGKNKFGRPSITYHGTYTGGYGEIETYGGKLTENIVQAVARDCLAVAMMRINEAGYDIVMHIHDEVVIEGRSGELDAVNAILAQPIGWAPGLPLKGDGFETYYYMKD